MENKEPLCSVRDIDWKSLTENKAFRPSPEAWEDQVLYFLLLDRFSDGKENGYTNNAGNTRTGGTTPLFKPGDENNAVNTPAQSEKWREAGNGWVGGNLKGLTSKMGYLERLGISAVWVSPVFKQAPWDKGSYHGYGIQNFLDIDPHFGTPEDLRDMVQTAHEKGIYVILDVIVNHAADGFAYNPDRYEVTGDDGQKHFDVKWDGNPYEVKGFRDHRGKPTLPFGPLDTNPESRHWPDAGIWPKELQTPEAWTRKGEMRNWENLPEYEEGDFFAYKDVHLGDWDGDTFVPSDALRTITDCYKYWIAFADLDGLRLDTVKHMGWGAVRFFAEEIHAFAKSIGKTNFYVIGEITGGRVHAFETLRDTSLDAALALNELPTRFRDVVTGNAAPQAIFDAFRAHFENTQSVPDPLWCGRSLVTFFDDHDQVGRDVKGRFAAQFGDDHDRANRAVLAAVGLNLTVMGIPCLYYGTEQGLSGHALDSSGGDRYVRESLFGGEFGTKGTRNRHFFDETNPLYQSIARLVHVRREYPALRQGNQFLRPVSLDGEQFIDPAPSGDDTYRGLVAWSRLLDDEDVVCVLNTDGDNEQTAWITLDAERHAPGGRPLKCLFSSETDEIGLETALPDAKNGSAVQITVKPGGFVIYA